MRARYRDIKPYVNFKIDGRELRASEIKPSIRAKINKAYNNLSKAGFNLPGNAPYRPRSTNTKQAASSITGLSKTYKAFPLAKGKRLSSRRKGTTYIKVKTAGRPTRWFSPIKEAKQGNLPPAKYFRIKTGRYVSKRIFGNSESLRDAFNDWEIKYQDANEWLLGVIGYSEYEKHVAGRSA